MISETNGQAALSFVLVMGAIGLIIALLLSAYAISFVSGAYGYQSAQTAGILAESGVYDALIQLARNKDMTGTYSIPISQGTISVTATSHTPDVDKTTIVSSATVRGLERRIRVVVSVNQQTGLIALVSWAVQ
jgi:hypothetical protein